MKDPLPFLSEIDFIQFLIKMEAKYLTILTYKYIHVCNTFIFNVFSHKRIKKNPKD